MEYKNQFEKDVIEGLQGDTKRLSSMYFYDDNGDKIFQEIMNMESYYLPESEREILETKTKDILNIFPFNSFNIIELGAGDGRKTVYFLKQIVEAGKNIKYYPLDISPDVLNTNEKNIQKIIPSLDIHKIAGDYFHTLGQLANHSPKILLFFGSNIGNYKNEKAIDFLKLLNQNMEKDDLLLVGFDLRKNPKTILKAYNDDEGITKRFNLNLLRRINNELDGNFDLNAFDHYPFYEPVEGITYSFIVSLKDQDVKIGDQNIHFEKHEMIHTEVSQKYNLHEINQLKDKAGFSSVEHFLDSKEFFSVSAFTK